MNMLCKCIQINISQICLTDNSNVQDAQLYSVQFANNNLRGLSKFLDGYKSSKTRVCVTVGMMTTGYDCEDLLNVALLRPIFSPTDFVQIKGRGTRRFRFRYSQRDGMAVNEIVKDKKYFKLFDFSLTVNTLKKSIHMMRYYRYQNREKELQDPRGPFDL